MKNLLIKLAEWITRFPAFISSKENVGSYKPKQSEKGKL
jgi:hypothetical protein